MQELNPAKGRRRRLTAADRREQLLAAAREVFLASGSHGARTRHIAEAAGVNEALLYQHFSSKEELFHEAVVQPLRDVISAVSAVGGTLPAFDPDARIQRDLTQQYLAELLRVLLDVTPLVGLVLFAGHESGTRFYGELVEPLLDAITEVVRGSFPTWSHRDFDARLVTTMVLGACGALAIERHFTGATVDADATAADITDLLFEGLLERPEQPAAKRRKSVRRSSPLNK